MGDSSSTASGDNDKLNSCSSDSIATWAKRNSCQDTGNVQPDKSQPLRDEVNETRVERGGSLHRPQPVPQVPPPPKDWKEFSDLEIKGMHHLALMRSEQEMYFRQKQGKWVLP